MRNQALDVLRGIAILLVLGFHYSYFGWWKRVGWTGVDLFFVLSGFLISGLLFTEFKQRGRIRIGRFLVRRGFRIYPPFYLLMSITAVSVFLGRNRLRLFIPEILFVQNYFPHIWGQTWSLAVEEHFYILLPLFLLFLQRIRRQPEFRSLPWVLVGVMLACLVLRCVAVLDGVPTHAIQLETQFRMDSLACGVLIGYFYHFRRPLFDLASSMPLWIPGLALISISAFYRQASPVMLTVGFSSLCIGFGCILIWAVPKPRRPSRLLGCVEWIGRHSYSIYLWHLPVGVFLFPGVISFRFFLEGIAASIVVGAVMAKLVELPSTSIRDKLFPRDGSPVKTENHAAAGLQRLTEEPASVTLES